MANDLERVTAALAGRFTVHGEIGRGGMATVYRATDLRLGRQVAIKVLRPELSSAIGTERFRREIGIAAGLNHPHIVSVYDSGEADGLLYFVMPHVQGHTLREELDRHGPLPLERALAITRDIAEGLDHAHSVGIVHRDIKPRNIMLADGHALVADFGVARAIEAAGGDHLTSSGIAIGTPAYMSPEQASGNRDVDARSDVYSLGCMFYEMVSGELPFRAKNVQALLSQHIAGNAPSLTLAGKGVPIAVADAVDRALAKSPDARFSTATDFVTRLAAATEAPQLPLPAFVRSLRMRMASLALSTRILLVVLSLVVLVGSALLLKRMVGGPAAWPNDRPPSLVVLPFSVAGSDADAAGRTFAIDLAAEISSELDGWETIASVPQVALAGPMFDLGLTGSIVERVEDGIRLAKEFEVKALLAVTVRIRNDSADVEATVFNAESGRSVGAPYRIRGPTGSPLRLAGGIVAGLLGLDPAVASTEAPYRHSANPLALEQDAAGRLQLERWQLRDAERSFRSAIDLDSTFAMAHHRLAETLYWQAARNDGLLATVAPEIARESAAALRHASGLSPRDSMHIRAFFGFQAGDFETARTLYDRLVDRDSMDVYAWLMVGCVEYEDRWLARSDTASWRPRSDLNRARHAFQETLRLQPTFELGYGHLFDIHAVVVDAIDKGICLPFEEPTGEQVAPWYQPPLQNPQVFCAVQLDSLAWLPRPALANVTTEAKAGADRLFRTSLGLLRRWADYSPSQPEPRRRLVTALLLERSRLRAPDAARMDSLTDEALSEAAQALALSRDTLAVDVIRLANLQLAADSVDRALELNRLGLALSGDSSQSAAPIPLAAANVFLATGRPTRALRLASPAGVTRTIRDRTTGELISYGGAVPVIERLRVLAASGVTGAAIRTELDRLNAIWSGPSYSSAQQISLRRSAALRLAPALLLEPGALLAWNEGLQLDEPLWEALVLSDTAPVSASAKLALAIADPPSSLSEATNAFLLGVVAARTGDHRTAARLFSRLDSVPLAVDAPDVNWGTRWIARLHRAASYEALGQSALAIEDYEDFSRAWSAADSLAAPLLETARRRAAALRSGR